LEFNKMRFLKIFVFCIFFCMTCHGVFAITLENCKELSLKNSNLITAYENLIKSSIYSYQKDKSSILPQLTAFYQPDNVQFSDRSDLARTHGFETKVGSVLSIDLQKILTDYPQLGRLEMDKNKLIKAIAENEIQKDTIQHYYRLYVLLNKKKDYMDTYDFFNMHIKDIEEAQSKGVDVALDINRAQVQLKILGISLKNINNEINNVLIDLNSMMNTTYTEADFAVMDTPQVTILESKDQDYSHYEQSKLDEFDLKIAKETYEQSKLYYMPTIQLGFEHNTRTVDPNIEEYKTYLALNFNIFDFGQKANEEKQLKYAYEYRRGLFKESERKLQVRITQLTADIKNLQAVYESWFDNLNNAQKSLGIAKTYYKQGKIKETDLLSVFSDDLNVKDQTYEALYNFLAQSAELKAITQEDRK